MAIRVIDQQQVGQVEYNYFKIGAITLLAIAAIGATCFMGAHQWNLTTCSHIITNLFSTNQLFRATVISFVGITTLLLVCDIAHTYSQNYRSKRLKQELMPLGSCQALQEIVKHNASYFANSEVIRQALEGKDITEDAIASSLVKMMVDDAEIDPLIVLEKLSQLYPEKDWEQINPEQIALLKQEAGCLLKQRGYSHIPMIEQFKSAKDAVVTGLGAVVGAIAISELFKRPGSTVERGMQAQKLYMFVMLLGMVSPILLAAVGPIKTAIVLGTFVCGITALDVLLRYFTPLPPVLASGARNWSGELVKKKLDVLHLRPDVCRQIYTALKARGHVLLIGPPGVGKTAVLKELTYYMANNPDFKDWSAIYANGASIAKTRRGAMEGGTEDPLGELVASFGRHKVVLMVDEAHAMKSMIDLIKTKINPGSSEIAYSIWATTVDEYKRDLSQDPALMRRWHIMSISPEVNEAAMLLELFNQVEKSTQENPAQQCLIEPGVIEHLYKISCSMKESQQPKAAFELLDQCKLRIGEDKDLEEIKRKITEIDQQMEVIYKTFSFFSGRNRQGLLDLSQEKTELEQQADKRLLQADKISRTHKMLDKVKEAQYRTAIKVAKLAESRLDIAGNQTVKYFRTLQFFENSITTYIQNVSKCMSIESTITRDLVDTVARQLEEGLK